MRSNSSSNEDPAVRARGARGEAEEDEETSGRQVEGSGDAERGWCQARDLQSDPEEDPGDAIVAANGSLGELRPDPQRVLLRQASGRVRAGAELLSHREAALSHGRVRTALRAGTGVLGLGLESGRSRGYAPGRLLLRLRGKRRFDIIPRRTGRSYQPTDFFHSSLIKLTRRR